MNAEMNTQLSKPVAPEDLCVGDYVTALQVLREQLPFLFDDESFLKQTSPRRTYVLPCGPAPFRVVELCLPYVLVESPNGKHRMLDLRRIRVARLSEQFGRTAFERMKPKVEPEEKKGDSSDSGKEQSSESER